MQAEQSNNRQGRTAETARHKGRADGQAHAENDAVGSAGAGAGGLLDELHRFDFVVGGTQAEPV